MDPLMLHVDSHHFLDSIENLIAESLSGILTKDPFEADMTHIMVDNCDIGQITGQANS
jgi:hypothetical protein